MMTREAGLLSAETLAVKRLSGALAEARRRQREDAVRRVAAGESQVAVAKSLDVTQAWVSELVRQSGTQ